MRPPLMYIICPTSHGRAADKRQRRCTQIRLAQRAYRLRKESTISSLKDRVTKLERTLSEINNIFLAFNDSAVESGILRIKPQLALKLEQTTERFAALTRTSVHEPEYEDQRIEDLEARDLPTPNSDAMITRKIVNGHRSSGDSSSWTSSRPASVRQPHTMGYEPIGGETPGLNRYRMSLWTGRHS